MPTSCKESYVAFKTTIQFSRNITTTHFCLCKTNKTIAKNILPSHNNNINDKLFAIIQCNLPTKNSTKYRTILQTLHNKWQVGSEPIAKL